MPPNMFKVVKRLHFCYGHRLLEYEGKCAHPHGHNAEVEIEVESAELDPRGMLFDFGDIAEALSSFIDNHLDHRMILRRDDPLAEALLSLGEPVHLMAVNPTAENIARLLYEEGRRRGLPIAAVRLWETPRAYAEYRPAAGEA